MILYKSFIWLIGLRDFYDESHLKNMEYFTLYLRTFKDDSHNTDVSKHIISLFYNFFCPFAVGTPNDFLPPRIGAPRLYLGENWQENVLHLMNNAQIILLRVGKTDNFLWEYYNVVQKDYLSKTIFWIKDVYSLREFVDALGYINSEKSSFPNESLRNRSLEIWNTHPNVFQTEYLACYHDERWIILDKSSKRSFVKDFTHNHLQIIDKCRNYLYGYNSLYKYLIRIHYDDNIMCGIPKWDWLAFLFPEFFVITHRVDKVSGIVIFWAIDSVLVNMGIFALRSSTIMCIVVFLILFLSRLVIMFFMGRNGRIVEWLSEKWESVNYFDKMYQANNKMLLFMVASVLGGGLLLLLESMI